MRLQFKHFSMIAASVVLIGCGGGGSSAPASGNTGGTSGNSSGNNTNTGSTGNTSGNTNTTDTVAPVFKTTNYAYTVPENKRYISDTQADDDQSEVSYSIVSGDDKDKFSIDKHNGTLIFKNAPDYENPDDLDDNHIYEVTIQATDVSGNTATQDVTVTIEDKNESIPKSYTVLPLQDGSNSYDVGTNPKNVYILFTNTSKSTESTPSVTHNKLVSLPESKKEVVTSNSMFERVKILHAPAYIQAFNSHIRTLLHKNDETSLPQAKQLNTSNNSIHYDIVGGNAKYFSIDENGNEKVRARAKKVVRDIQTKFGSKTLNIWVAEDSFEGPSCTKSKCVTQAMVDEFADNFLKEGDDNDIYDWVTNIYGEEWGSDAATKYSNLIGANDEITILLTDIDNDDNPSGGTIGYFWSKDNVKQSSISGSNERIMFYADAVMFANDENNGFWQKEMYSTLAHEFQHMIHFYQKTVLLDATDDTWINEMLSETTEDLIATKIQHTGPRGVAYTDGSAGDTGNRNGRYPIFNENNTISLTTWNNSMADYSKVNAFGTFLTRNYGGAKVLHDIMYNKKEHEDAIETAIGKSFDDLLKEWGIAVMLSDRTDAKKDQYSYNTGDFTVNEKLGTIYKMGAINFFNYSSQPTISSNIGTVKPQGNYYYKVGDNLTGNVTIDLTLDTNTKATLIVK